MTTFLGIYLVVLSLVLVGIMRRDAVLERCALLSTRNFFILGLILFQTSSGAVTLLLDETERGAEIEKPELPALAFCVILTVFIAVFLWIYRHSNFVERFASARTRIRLSSRPRLILTGVSLTLIGVALRFAGARIPYVAVLLPQLSAGCLCAGAALVAMAWARSAWNIANAIIFALVIGASSATLLVDAFGRRELIGLFLAAVWGFYYENWRLMSAAKLFPRVIVAVAALSTAVLAFSASRVGGQDVDRSLGQQVQRILEIDVRDVRDRFVEALAGQYAGGISMYLFDARLRDSEYDPMHSLLYFATLPIPRDFWPGKYEGLGATAPDKAGVTRVADEFSWGPGLVGHLCNDIVFLALPVYAALLAFAFRYMDSRTSLSLRDPLCVAVFGSALGQMLGMPRGEIGLFAFNMVAALAGAWFVGLLCGKLFLPVDRDAEAADLYDADGYAADDAYELADSEQSSVDESSYAER